MRFWSHNWGSQSFNWPKVLSLTQSCVWHCSLLPSNLDLAVWLCLDILFVFGRVCVAETVSLPPSMLNRPAVPLWIGSRLLPALLYLNSWGKIRLFVNWLWETESVLAVTTCDFSWFSPLVPPGPWLPLVWQPVLCMTHVSLVRTYHASMLLSELRAAWFNLSNRAWGRMNC